MLGVSFDKGLYESSFAHSGRPNHSDDKRRGFLGQAVNEGDMEPLFFDLYSY